MATYDSLRFRTSHNSYSGGDRGSIEKQLNDNVRCLEFDFHDNDFETFKDYRIGHLKPGAEVDHKSPNPKDSLLGSWLGVVSAWSTANPGHTPITIILDAKDDLTDNDAGDLEDLNSRLDAVFGARLFTRDDFDRQRGWPDEEKLGGKIVCVLSGNGASRAAYRWSFGKSPAVGANAGGDVVLAYRSTSGEINCWTGCGSDDETKVEWRRKQRLAVTDIDLDEPAIAINDDRWVVAVYRFGPRPQAHGLMLMSRLGRLQDDGRISWFKNDQNLGAGASPSLRINGDKVELIHTTEDGGKRRLMTGVIDTSKRKIRWQKAKETQRQPFTSDEAAWDTRVVKVSTDRQRALKCSIDDRRSDPVRFRQVVFVERQKGEDPDLFRDAQFFGAGAANQADIDEARREGLVARGWGFSEPDRTNPPRENFPATDTPYTNWYQDYVD